MIVATIWVYTIASGAIHFLCIAYALCVLFEILLDKQREAWVKTLNLIVIFALFGCTLIVLLVDFIYCHEIKPAFVGLLIACGIGIYNLTIGRKRFEQSFQEKQSDD